MCKFGEYQTADFFQHIGEIITDYEVYDSWEATDIDLRRAAFAEVTTATEAAILDLIKADKRITPQAIAEALKIDRATIARKMAEMTAKGIIEQIVSPTGEIERKGTVKPPADIERKTTEVLLRYTYEKRPIAPGADIIDTTRPFCRKLIELNRQGRMYTRGDIESISTRLGYSVFERAGGFWFHDGKTDIQCRHFWKANILTRRK
jgi:hypothetical protein